MQISAWRSRLPCPGICFLIVFSLIGIILRCSFLTHQSLWFDEVASIRMAQSTDLFQSDFHPPLYFSLLYGWITIFGSSEVAVRLLSALIGIASLGVVGVVAAKEVHSSRAAGTAVLLTSCSFTHLWYSQEVRSYILLFLESAILLEIYRRWILNPRSLRLTVMLTGINTILLYTHYGAALLLFAQGCHVAYLAFNQKSRLLEPEGYILNYALVVLGTTMLSAPLLQLILTQSHQVANGKLWIAAPALRDVYLLLPRLFFYTPAFLGRPAILIINGLVVISLLYLIITRRGLTLLYFHIVIPPALALLLSLFGVQMFVPKVMIIILPALIIACTQILCRLPFGIATGLYLAYISAQGLLIFRYYSTPQKEEWRAVATFLSENTDGNDTFYFTAPGTKLALDYYYQIGDHQVRYSLAALQPGHEKLWIIHALTPEPLSSTLMQVISRGYAVVQQRRAAGIRIAECRFSGGSGLNGKDDNRR